MNDGWGRYGLVLGRGDVPESWNWEQVRSPSVIYWSGITLMAYEGFDSSGLRGIGFALGIDQWLIPSETELQFEQIYQTRDLTLRNGGMDNLQILDSEYTGEGFILDGPDLPLILEPGESINWRVMFFPRHAGQFSGEITFHLDSEFQSSQKIHFEGYQGQ